MIQEFIGIVDENNNPTGEAVERGEAHRRGLWHRAVHVYFFRRTPKGLEFLVHL